MDLLGDALAAMRVARPGSTLTRLRPPWGLRFDKIPGAGFHVVLQGSCWLLPPLGPAVPLGTGDVVFLRSGRRHGLADDPGTALGPFPPADPLDAGGGQDIRTVLLCGAYHLDLARPHPLLAQLPEVIHLPSRLGRHPSLRAAVDLLGRELDTPGFGSGSGVPMLVDLLLLYILRAWFDDQAAGANPTGWVLALRDQPIRSALQEIHSGPSRPWTVAELARRAGMSRATFARRFTDTVGQPPLSYLTWWRMTTAARRLRESDAPLSAIAKDAGYTSQFAFARAFKREFGDAPGHYRRLAAGPAS
ncbi:AraC family transcriptional regulator [Phytohabitans houttuyneae]|uniref:AraC family transcriptional regulator n=1 Tax=Phytohabitans houttuyneae TaxID=1076126 RepID=A0A6V8KGQ9_9ACTN|nr:AraC family transcriptional regulator [Phytohabitans houttuyneae]GFJ81269.1 AraC family transcriptional regulator [Phytohabitans houttuyneae]